MGSTLNVVLKFIRLYIVNGVFGLDFTDLRSVLSVYRGFVLEMHDRIDSPVTCGHLIDYSIGLSGRFVWRSATAEGSVLN